MYEEPKMTVVYIFVEDIIRTSNDDEWKDDNVEPDGWT